MYRNTIEQQYRKQIEALLAPLVGNEGVRVAVSADIDFAKTESSSVVYGQGHLLSQQQQSTNPAAAARFPPACPAH
jgi:Flagellar biosynthesis/type III secretory pathway lipoprotein